jgi:hypothetical protein
MTAPPMPALPTEIVTQLVPPAVSGAPWAPEAQQGVLAWDASAYGAPVGPDATADGDAPQLQAWANRLAQAVVEVVAGHRPPAQLVRWTSRTVFRDLERRTRLAQRAASMTSGAPVQRSSLRPHVRSVHVCRIGEGVAEASIHVRHGRRSRAIAMRLEVTRERWTCTAVEFA